MNNVIGFFIGAPLSYLFFGKSGLILFLGAIIYICFDSIIKWIAARGEVPYSQVNTTKWEE